MSQVITTNHTYKNEKLFILIENIMPTTIAERAVRHRHVIQIYEKKIQENSVIFIEQKMQSDHKKTQCYSSTGRFILELLRQWRLVTHVFH